MIKELKNKFNILKVYFNLNEYKMFLVFVFSISFFNLFNISNNVNASNVFIFSLSTTMYQLILFILIFIYLILILKRFDRNLFSIIRYENKSIYIDKIITITSIYCVFYYLSAITINFILVFIRSYLFYNFSLNFDVYLILYNIFTVIKYGIMINLLLTISILIYKCFLEIVGTLFFTFLILLKEGYPYSFEPINSFGSVKLFYGYYLNSFQYGNIFLEISSFLLECCILILLILILKKIILRKKVISVL